MRLLLTSAALVASLVACQPAHPAYVVVPKTRATAPIMTVRHCPKVVKVVHRQAKISARCTR